MKIARQIGVALSLISAPITSMAGCANCSGPVAGTFVGDRQIETVPVTICAETPHWQAVQRLNPADTWVGEALADTGLPDRRWLKIGPRASQCWKREAPIGSRIGTMYQCPGTVEGWYWTEVITGPGTYHMKVPGLATAISPAG